MIKVNTLGSIVQAPAEIIGAEHLVLPAKVNERNDYIVKMTAVHLFEVVP